MKTNSERLEIINEHILNIRCQINMLSVNTYSPKEYIKIYLDELFGIMKHLIEGLNRSGT